MKPKVISSLDHPLVKHLAKLRLNRDYRHEHETVIIAGTKPVAEIAKDSQIKTFVLLDETFLPSRSKADEVLIVTEAIMKKISGMQSPEGILVEAKMPKQANLKGKKKIVVLDGISDPGNMGTILRTALALGWDGAFITENSCDPFNDKALRAARGATFRLPIYMGNWSQLKELIDQNKWKPIVAELKGSSPDKIAHNDKVVLVLNNEAHGMSPEAKAICEKVSIPMSGKMESLNVSIAGGILMYLIGK